MASVLLGVILGLGALDVVLRLTTYEHEANRNYWGRGAFVSDDTFGYRHAPSTSLLAGRMGQFGPLRVSTNELGYRDKRLPEWEGEGEVPPRLLVVGASFIFGLGLDDDDELFHELLERDLRAREEFPPDLEVFNISQTGFLVRDLAQLAESELERFAPRSVLLVIRPTPQFTRVPEGADVDIVNGYRMPGDRSHPGGRLDQLRTLSPAWQRVLGSPLLTAAAYLEDQLALRAPFLQGVWIDPPAKLVTQAERQEAYARVRREILRLAGSLRRFDVSLTVLVVAPPETKFQGLAEALEGRPIEVIKMKVKPHWTWGDDAHWTTEGTRLAAEHVAAQLSPEPFR
ncbi:MAG: hypothetical protein ACYTCU_06210 [Planctomycetota bacterium]